MSDKDFRAVMSDWLHENSGRPVDIDWLLRVLWHREELCAVCGRSRQRYDGEFEVLMLPCANPACGHAQSVYITSERRPGSWSPSFGPLEAKSIERRFWRSRTSDGQWGWHRENPY